MGIILQGGLCGCQHTHSHFGLSHGSHGHTHGPSNHSPNIQDTHTERGEIIQTPKHHVKEKRNINVKAALIHVIGDLIQSIGVLIAAYIIKYKVGLF